jgi:hypothetical protein
MSTEQPEWLKNQEPVPPQAKNAGRPDWVRGMKSPNPAGRPKGIVDKKLKVVQALSSDAPAVIRVVIDAALAGDIQAASLVLSRVAPALKPQTGIVTFELDEAAPLTTQAQQIMKAVSNGELEPDTGKMLMDCLGTMHGIRQLDEFASRLAALEHSMRR